jgi:hypothetical protein
MKTSSLRRNDARKRVRASVVGLSRGVNENGATGATLRDGVGAAVGVLTVPVMGRGTCKGVGSFVAEDFATSMFHSWSFKTDKPGGST